MRENRIREAISVFAGEFMILATVVREVGGGSSTWRTSLWLWLFKTSSEEGESKG